MNIGSTGSMQQMQMRKMDGTGMGQGNGQGKMSEIMQQLPQEDKTAIKEQMQSLDPAQRKDMVSQISQMDTSSMSVDEITASILDLLSPKEEESTTSTSSFSVYA